MFKISTPGASHYHSATDEVHAAIITRVLLRNHSTPVVVSHDCYCGETHTEFVAASADGSPGLWSPSLN